MFTQCLQAVTAVKAVHSAAIFHLWWSFWFIGFGSCKKILCTHFKWAVPVAAPGACLKWSHSQGATAHVGGRWALLVENSSFCSTVLIQQFWKSICLVCKFSLLWNPWSRIYVNFSFQREWTNFNNLNGKHSNTAKFVYPRNIPFKFFMDLQEGNIGHEKGCFLNGPPLFLTKKEN